MERWIPIEKQQKKKQRAYAAQQRGSWGALNPVTRKPANPKAYNRKKARNWREDSSTTVPFDCFGRQPKAQRAACLRGVKRYCEAQATHYAAAVSSGGCIFVLCNVHSFCRKQRRILWKTRQTIQFGNTLLKSDLTGMGRIAYDNKQLDSANYFFEPVVSYN